MKVPYGIILPTQPMIFDNVDPQLEEYYKIEIYKNSRRSLCQYYSDSALFQNFIYPLSVTNIKYSTIPSVDDSLDTQIRHYGLNVSNVEYTRHKKESNTGIIIEQISNRTIVIKSIEAYSDCIARISASNLFNTSKVQQLLILHYMDHKDCDFIKNYLQNKIDTVFINIFKTFIDFNNINRIAELIEVIMPFIRLDMRDVIISEMIALTENNVELRSLVMCHLNKEGYLLSSNIKDNEIFL